MLVHINQRVHSSQLKEPLNMFITAMRCPILTPPANGVITMATLTLFRITATYGCNAGFGVSSGDITRTCQESTTPGIGEWNGTAVICESMCSLHTATTCSVHLEASLSIDCIHSLSMKALRPTLQ